MYYWIESLNWDNAAADYVYSKREIQVELIANGIDITGKVLGDPADMTWIESELIDAVLEWKYTPFTSNCYSPDYAAVPSQKLVLLDGCEIARDDADDSILQDDASNLYAAGWTSEDKGELEFEYQMNSREIDYICQLLDEFAAKEEREENDYE